MASTQPAPSKALPSKTKSNDDLELLVFTTYLEPLLNKHSTNQSITYEDLVGSWSSAMRTLGRQQNKDSDQAMRDKLKTLHQSQMDAYHRTAHSELLQWAKTDLKLPPVASTSLESYKKECVLAAEASRPQWNVDKAFLTTEVSKAVEERAIKAFEKEHPNKETLKEEEPSQSSEIAEGNTGDENSEEDEGEVNEEEEEGGEDEPETAKPSKPKDPVTMKKANDDSEETDTKAAKPLLPAKALATTASKKGKAGINAKRKAANESVKSPTTGAKRQATAGRGGKRGGRKRGGR